MVVLSVVFVLLAAYSDFASPLQMVRNGRTVGSNPDEMAHLLNARHVASGHLPVFHAGAADYEAHQPPLYYALVAPFTWATGHVSDETAARIIRIPSILFGLLLIWVTFATVRLLLPSRPWIAFGSGAFVGLLPMNVTLAASITNDVLTNLLIAVALWKMAKVAESGEAGRADSVFRRSRVLGIILGVGIWTKTSTLLLFPTAAVLYYVLVKRGAINPRDARRSFVAAIGIALVIGLPWLVRNTMLYGDPVAQHIFVTAFQNTALAQDMISGKNTHIPLTPGEYWLWVAMWTFVSFWVRRGTVPDVWITILQAVAVLSVIGTAAFGVRNRGKLSAAQAALLAGFATLVFLGIVVFLRFNATFFQAQGRYLYPALVPLAFFTVAGLTSLAPAKAERAVIAALIIVLLLCGGVSLLAIAATRPL